MTTYFYDGQIRRYLLQVIRLLSNFAVRYGDGSLSRVPVMYGDPDRQASHIINQNSENTIQSAPRIAVYMSGLELDVNRLADSSYVGKLHIRERAWNPTGGVDGTGAYENFQGNTYTIERLMPTPYKLNIKVDIWTTSNDQKLQVLEQLLMLFNPSLEIQTTDNYIDWTSLSVVDLTDINYSSRTVPVGTTTSIDIATISLQTPIWISPPAKVKRLGIVTTIISNIFSQQSSPYGDYYEGLGTDPQATDIQPINQLTNFVESALDYEVEVTANSVKIVSYGETYPSWENLLEKLPGEYTPGLSRIYLKINNGNNIVGYFTVNPITNDEIVVNWDQDTYPGNTLITTDFRASPGTFDAIIDPKKTGPRDPKLPELVAGSRYLIIDNIGGGIRDTFTAETKIQRINTNTPYSKVNDHKVYVNGIEVGSGNARIPDNLETGVYYITLDESVLPGSEITYILNVNEDGPDAWKNNDGSDFIAEENDVIEWDGEKWNVVFSADENNDRIIYLTNIFTGSQYIWNGITWGKTFEKVYRTGEWAIEL